MRKTVECAAFTGKDFSDVIAVVLPTLLPKAMVNKVGSRISKELLSKIRNQPKAKVVRMSAFAKAERVYKNNLRLAGFSGKGRPSTTNILSAVNMMTSEELRDLELGKSRKWRNEIPAELSIGNSIKPF
jgi:hypothetical protein